jgi:hypothetical protein
MIKKLIWLIILGVLVYLGYLVWGNLNRQEKDAVVGCGTKVVDKTKDMAKTAADKLTDKTKEVIHDKVMDKSPPKKDSSTPGKEPFPPTGPPPGGNVIRFPAEAPAASGAPAKP